MKSRYTVDLSDDFQDNLTKLAAKRQTTKSDVIKRAVITYLILSNLIDENQKLSITDANGVVLKEIIFY